MSTCKIVYRKDSGFHVLNQNAMDTQTLNDHMSIALGFDHGIKLTVGGHGGIETGEIIIRESKNERTTIYHWEFYGLSQQEEATAKLCFQSVMQNMGRNIEYVEGDYRHDRR